MTSTRAMLQRSRVRSHRGVFDVVAKNIFRAKMDNASNVAQAIIAYCDYKEDVRRGAFPVSNWAHCASKAIKQELSHQRIVQFRS
ncbi:MAG TPA: hypothetical protein VJ255_22900, partial [Candidatus Acidoferrum sp.]|nr:hypothetical protein [Candidatus Acidoferrum sp.]